MVVGMMAKNGWAGGTQAAAAALVLDGCCCCRLPDGRCPDIKGGLFAVLRNRSGARSDSGGRTAPKYGFRFNRTALYSVKLFDTKERRERMRAQVHSAEAEREGESLAALQMPATDTRTYKV